MKILSLHLILMMLVCTWAAPAVAGDKQIVIELTEVQMESVRTAKAKDKSVIKTFLNEAQLQEIAAAFPDLKGQLRGEVQGSLPLGEAPKVMAGPFNGLQGHISADGTQLVLERAKPR